MPYKPVRSQPGNLFQRTRFFEQVGRARDNRKLALTMDERLACSLVQLDHAMIVASNDEERRRTHGREQRWTGEIRPTAAGDDGADVIGPLRRNP
jgi:hypothetical protein